MGLSPAPMVTFPAAPPKIPYGGFSPVRLKVPGTAQFSRGSSGVGDGLSLIRTCTTRPRRWPSPSDSPRLESFPPRCAGLQRPATPPGPRGPRSGEFVMASPSTLADLIRQSGFLRSISQRGWLQARSSTFKDPPVWIPDLPSFRCLALQNCRLQLPPGDPIRALPHSSASALAID